MSNNVAQYRASAFMLGEWVDGTYVPGYWVSGWQCQVDALVNYPRCRSLLRRCKRGSRLV